MTRAFAIAVTGGTQALVIILWSIPFGDVDTLGETWLVGVGFAINSGVAELLILRRSRRTPGGEATEVLAPWRAALSERPPVLHHQVRNGRRISSQK